MYVHCMLISDAITSLSPSPFFPPFLCSHPHPFPSLSSSPLFSPPPHPFSLSLSLLFPFLLQTSLKRIHS